MAACAVPRALCNGQIWHLRASTLKAFFTLNVSATPVRIMRIASFTPVCGGMLCVKMQVIQCNTTEHQIESWPAGSLLFYFVGPGVVSFLQ